MPDSLLHYIKRNRGREVVVLVAITAIDVATAYGHDVRLDNVAGTEQALRYQAKFSKESGLGG
jgi:hypothetical protein